VLGRLEVVKVVEHEEEEEENLEKCGSKSR
jgi:hypothetical protein